MADLVFITVFYTHMYRTKLTKRQKFKTSDDFRQTNKALC